MKTKTIKTVSIKIENPFTYTAKMCISILMNRKSSAQAIKDAQDELLRYAGELDRLSK